MIRGNLVPGVPPAIAGLSSARGQSLPPDGLLCNYHTHLCHGQRLQGYEFCIRHILEDKSAPYKPCAYISDTQHGVKCPRAAPRTSRGEGFCRDHSRAVVTARSQLGKRRHGQGASQAALLESLAPYKRVKEGDPLPKCERGRLGQLVLHGEGLGDCDGSDSDCEMGDRVGDHWKGDGDSEGESVDSEGEDYLKHAGVYTGEEVMRTMRDKLIRLQKLYIEQFGRLQHKMREGRRTYLSQLRSEKEAGMMSIHSQPRDGGGAMYTRLKALAHYHSPAGREALLAARHRDKRASVPGTVNKREGVNVNKKESVIAPCQHQMTSTTKCGEGVVPMSRYCPRHILEQQGQVLYRQCGVITDPQDGPCETPVVALFSYTTCVFHTRMRNIAVRQKNDPDINTIVNDVFNSVDSGVKDVFCSVGDSLEEKDNGDFLNHEIKDEVLDVKDDISKEVVNEAKSELDNEVSGDKINLKEEI